MLRLDREVLDLLRQDPELLAIADAIAATRLLDAEQRWLVGARELRAYPLPVCFLPRFRCIPVQSLLKYIAAYQRKRPS
jgi:hypothetical protein